MEPETFVVVLEIGIVSHSPSLMHLLRCPRQMQNVEDDLSLLLESVKICISSRPSPFLNDEFEDCPKLRLQDFTKRDITTCVHDNLIEHIAKRFSIGKDSEQTSLLVDTVVHKAEGVFLWVRLAVKSLRRGIGKNDRVDDLEWRLEQMPQGLDQLYSHMWKRIEADHAIYAAEAATYLQLILHFGSDSMSLLQLAVASDKDLQDAYLDSGWEQPESWHNLGQDLDSVRFETRLMACCAGLLEIRDWYDRDEPDDESLSWNSSTEASLDGESSNTVSLNASFLGLQRDSPLAETPDLLQRLGGLRDIHERTRVSLIHKSAGGYFRQGDGKASLDKYPLCKQDMRMRAFRAVEVLLLLLVIPTTPGDVTKAVKGAEISDILLYLVSQSAVTLLSDLERICERLQLVYLLDFARWPRVEGSNAVDYMLVFMGLDAPDYTSFKLNQPGTIRSQKNLDGWLFQAIYSFCMSSRDREYALYPPWPRAATNIEVLLQCKADPNAKKHLHLASPGATLWLTFLVMRHTVETDCKVDLSLRLLEAFMRAGANPNDSCNLCLTPDDFHTSSRWSTWTSSDTQVEGLEDKIYMRWNVMDILTSFEYGSEALALMQGYGAQSCCANGVLYRGPSSLMSLSDENPRELWSTFKLGSFKVAEWRYLKRSKYFSTSIEPWFSLEFTDSGLGTYTAGFDNRNDALRAAGWQEESIECTDNIESMGFESGFLDGAPVGIIVSSERRQSQQHGA
ncbi:hypothetical protein EDD37DRAFT_607939 [Exophiala viscosa]|uniref:Uncharacterized protein n=1 Tax=Exophiala viscosa TaxID=2486360 RepID=A0AAN6IF76_9EURO|nr:hypothetical protein EDD36DRAFT_419439 [Exophiala viscosa]KAI1626373.1 hypothetical protein EDD37DRAFT_607939 [Exophiala viscosa]